MTAPGKIHSHGNLAETVRPDIVRSISSDDLMAGGRVVVIRHGGDEYKLQITSAGKLILTK
jgi:hemin uptake protein HemP